MQRACYLHACLKRVNREYMTNSSLRERLVFLSLFRFSQSHMKKYLKVGIESFTQFLYETVRKTPLMTGIQNAVFTKGVFQHNNINYSRFHCNFITYIKIAYAIMELQK